jgi:hypothetical protein
MREIATFLAVLGALAGCGSAQARPGGPPPEYEEPDASAAPSSGPTATPPPAPPGKVDGGAR